MDPPSATPWNSPVSFSSPLEYATELLNWANQYRWIYGCPLGEFFRNNVWASVPEEWKAPLMRLTFEQMRQLPTGMVLDEWPESLKSFVERCVQLRMPREPANRYHTNRIASAEKTERYFEVNMSPKKKHEVSLMAVLVKEVCDEAKLQQVVDVGAGKGYLSSLLAFEHGLCVTGIETNEKVVAEAVNRGKHIVTQLQKQVRRGELGVPSGALQFVHGHVAPEVSPREFCRLLLERRASAPVLRVASPDGPAAEGGPQLLVGLHMCGSLTPTMMRLFGESELFGAMVVVGCCYYKLEGAAGTRFNFPVSRALQAMGAEVGVTGLKLSCDSVARWVATMDEPAMLNYVRTSCFHCAAQSLLMPLYPTRHYARVWQSGRTKRYQCGSVEDFRDYIKALLTRQRNLERTHDPTPEEIDKAYEQGCSDLQVAQMGAYLTLRAIFSPILESLVLVDRYLFLLEMARERAEEVDVRIVPLFNEEVSPRNLVFVAVKKNKRSDSTNNNNSAAQ